MATNKRLSASTRSSVSNGLAKNSPLAAPFLTAWPKPPYSPHPCRGPSASRRRAAFFWPARPARRPYRGAAGATQTPPDGLSAKLMAATPPGTAIGTRSPLARPRNCSPLKQSQPNPSAARSRAELPLDRDFIFLLSLKPLHQTAYAAGSNPLCGFGPPCAKGCAVRIKRQPSSTITTRDGPGRGWRSCS